MMAATQVLEHLSTDVNALDLMTSAKEWCEDSRLGTDLARSLIQHVCRMRAGGYDNQIIVDGEIWVVQFKRTGSHADQEL